VSNVVRLPGAPVRALPTERLSGTEQDAFRRIAETLGVKMPEGMRTPEERRRSETAARTGAASEAEPDTRLLDKLPVGIVVYRERGILFVNRTLLDYLGYDTPEDFAKAGGAEAIFPDRGRAETAFPDAHGILTARRRDGADLRVEARLHAVPWGAATALMLSLVKHDPPPEPARNDSLVEHLVAAERRIDELATILDTATDGIVVIDEHGRIENINKSAEALFGVEAGAVVRQPFTELFAEESRKAALDYLDGLASNGVASVLNDGREVIGKVPKGGLIPLFMTMGRLGGGPKFCAVLRDITYWKNVEEELIAAKRAAETANAQKSEFLAKISHEIRTPLNAIIGFSEVMIAERFGPMGNERYRDYLRDIHVSGEHLLSLINDLLDLSKIEAGKLELAFEAVAVSQTIQECVALMQPQANRERIIIRTSLSAGVPNVVADQRSLRQILLNLLSNAIKFTGAGGQVIVATTLEESGEVVLRIRDTGIGMSEKDLETAMKPFRQVSTTGARRGEGTGLGLPLTKALVEANRAAFSIDSTPNQGTLVKITFPTTRVLAG
jgi:PAS domain S-box-containing protein